MKRIYRPLVAGMALIASTFIPTHATGQASESGPLSASSSVRGIKLSLTLPRTTYPRNALVVATITVRNQSKRQACVFVGGPMNPNGYEPFVDLFDDNGRPIETSVLDLFLGYPGPRPSPRPLLPHRKLTIRHYVVLRGPGLQTSISFIPNTTRNCTGTRWSNATPLLHVALTPPDTPAAHITTQGDRPIASLHYADITAHSLRYVDAAECSPDPTTAAEHPEWVRVKALEVTAGCPNPLAWRAVIGTLNRSVAWINYPSGT